MEAFEPCLQFSDSSKHIAGFEIKAGLFCCLFATIIYLLFRAQLLSFYTTCTVHKFEYGPVSAGLATGYYITSIQRGLSEVNPSLPLSTFF